MNQTHRPVLLAEAVTALLESPLLQAESPEKSILIDGTFGRGGHSRALLEAIRSDANLIAFDKDLQAIAEAKNISDTRFQIIHSSFANMSQHAEPASVAGVLLDLGISSPQVDEAERGFSFRRDGPLDMRMNTTTGLTAAQWLNQAGVDDIAHVIKTYGEERFALPIAKAILARRELNQPLVTTMDLANLVAGVIKKREPGQDPATRTFQALRIFINKELDDLALGLQAALDLLKPGGIALLSLPNYRCIERCMFQANWYPWCLPVHLYHFDMHSIRQATERAGLIVEKITYLPFFFLVQNNGMEQSEHAMSLIMAAAKG